MNRDGVGARHRVQVAATIVEDGADPGERFEPGAEAAASAARAFRDRAQAPVVRGI